MNKKQLPGFFRQFFVGGCMEFLDLKQVEAGWSVDKKCRAKGKDGKEYFLRISPLEKMDRVKRAFSAQMQAWELGIPVSKPHGWEIAQDKVLMWEEWLPGQDAEQVLPTLSQQSQNDYGQEAGTYLRLLHTLPAPEGIEDWESRFNEKIDRKIAIYRECPLQYEGGEALIQYILSHRSLLRGRPQTLQHGDYHVGNMMFCHNRLFIIDFDRPDAGDPWEEFNRIVWCAQLSPAFASGMIQGYFLGNPPLEFWVLLALYIASNTLSSLPWAIPFGKKEVRTMMNQAREVLDWYDQMRTTIPSWYLPWEGKSN